VDERLDMSQQYTLAAQKANSMIAASKKGWPAGRRRQSYVPLFLCPHGAPPGVLLPSLGHQHNRDVELRSRSRGRHQDGKRTHLLQREAMFVQPREEKLPGRPHCGLAAL